MNELRVEFEIKREKAEILAKSMTCEAASEPQMRSDVKLLASEKGLTLTINSKDLHSMRAAINTYMRWLSMCNSLVDEDTN